MNRTKEVEAWLEAYDNPMKEVVRRVRDIILHSDQRIAESIEWQAPTFSYRGNLASFFPHSKKHASLMVHRGAEIPGHHPRLEGSGDTGRVMKIASVAEANAAKDDLQHLVRSWCDWREAEGAISDERAPRSPKKPAAGTAKRPRKKARSPAAKKARKPAAKKARKPAPKKARKLAAKKARRPAAKKATKPAAKKARRLRKRS
jgi:hypothetical protein